MRFTGVGRDRKYEIRDKKYGIETNVECPREVQCANHSRHKKQEIRLSSVDIKILPKDHDSILFLSPALRGGYLISCFSLMLNAD